VESLIVHYDTTVDSVATGSTVVDTSGSGHNGTLHGVTYSSADRAFTFDGSNDYIEGTLNNPSGAWVHTVSCWYRAVTADNGVVWVIGPNSTNKQIALNNVNGAVYYHIYGCNSTPQVAVNLSDGVWHHLVAVFKNSETTATNGVITGRTFYMDGAEVPLVATNNQVALNLNANSTFRLGNQFNSEYQQGSISNFKIWSDVALTAEEVAMEYALGRTGKALNVTDTAVCIGGIAPRAQLDVRGIAEFDLIDVKSTARLNQYMGSRSGTFSGTGTFDLPANMNYSTSTPPLIGWEIHMTFGFSGTNNGQFLLTGVKDTSSTNVGLSETSHRTIEPNGAMNYGGTCYLTYVRETAAPVYYAKITVAQGYFNNVPGASNGTVHRFHVMYECVGCKGGVGASIYRGACYFQLPSSGRRPKFLRFNCTAGSVSGNYMINALTS
jgi:hypothetical protein